MEDKKALGYSILTFALILFLFTRNPTINIINDDYEQTIYQTIYISKEVHNELLKAYNDSVTEEAYCLYGTDKHNIIKINSSTRPPVSMATPYSISYAIGSCDKALGVVHFHIGSKEELCLPSDQDIYAWGYARAKYPDIKFHGIICNGSSFVFMNNYKNNFNYDNLKIVEY